jgi:phosphate acetyltransferase
MFLESMRKIVRNKGMRIVYPEGKQERALRAAVHLVQNNLVRPILLGNKKEIENIALSFNLDLSGISIIDPQTDPSLSKYAQQYYELRKHKGVTEDQALEKAQLPHYFGALLVKNGAADGMVSGLTSECKPFLPAFEIIKLKPECKRASSLFILEWPERLLFFADCAVNIDPDAKALAEIAQATAQTVRLFGYKPRVAFLSFSTYGSGKGALVDKVREAAEIAKRECPDVVLDGEVQFDTALLPDVAKKKAPNSPFAELGANVFIFPDLNCGNIAYKITERLAKATATGPILQGLNFPINDVSRGCSYEDLANVAVLTAAQATLVMSNSSKT